MHALKCAQSFGSQVWDACFAMQALIASGLTDDRINDTLKKGHDFIKKSQVANYSNSENN